MINLRFDTQWAMSQRLDYVVFGKKTSKMCLVSAVAKFGLIRLVIAPEASYLVWLRSDRQAPGISFPESHTKMRSRWWWLEDNGE